VQKKFYLEYCGYSINKGREQKLSIEARFIIVPFMPIFIYNEITSSGSRSSKKVWYAIVQLYKTGRFSFFHFFSFSDFKFIVMNETGKNKYSKEFKIPEGFDEILRNLTREILRSQPEDINKFGITTFLNCLVYPYLFFLFSI
jgi:hypothetical protein